MPDVCLSFVIVYNIYYCCYAKTSSSAVQKRHSKVYEQPIAPSLYSILLARNKDLILNLHSWDIKGEGLKWIYKTGRGVK